MWTTPVKPASRNPSSRIAARIGLSSTMTIFGDDSALMDQLLTRQGIHSTEEARAKPCNCGQLGLVRAHQSGRFGYATGRCEGEMPVIPLQNCYAPLLRLSRRDRCDLNCL